MELSKNMYSENFEQIVLGCEVCKAPMAANRGSRITCDQCENTIISRTRPVVKKIVPDDKETYSVSKKELMEMRTDKILSLNAYVYMAFRMDYSGHLEQPTINLKKFCDRWGITQYDVLQAVTALARKGFMRLELKQMQAQALSRDERIQALEESVSGQ
jgi:hypothetical protein